MRQHLVSLAHLLKLPLLLVVLAIAAVASVPEASRAATCPRIWEYDYYFDAAHTQWAGYCTGSCTPGGGWCTGVQTDYYVRYGGDYCGGCGQPGLGGGSQ